MLPNEILVRIVGQFSGVPRITAALLRDGVVVDAHFRRLIGMSRTELIVLARADGWRLVWPRRAR